MNILVLSISPWRNDNSVGNTLTNIFHDFPGAVFANIYLKAGVPDNSVCKQYYQIDEKMLLHGVSGRHFTFDEVNQKETATVMNQRENNFYNVLRKKRYTVFFMLRELIWKISQWKTKELKEFIEDFQPDIIFLLVNGAIYSNKIADFVKKVSGRPMVGYVWDDVYAFSGYSPLKWLYQASIRKAIRKTVGSCSYLYTISEIQRQEYGALFRKSCKLLWKGKDFDKKPLNQESETPIQFVYTGNISGGRWKELAAIGEALKKINSDKKRAELDIYTLTPMTAEMRNAFASTGTINLKEPLTSEQVKLVQREADVLVHVESLQNKYKKLVRQSFSTKLVDYMSEAKCIFVIGSSDVASVDYLIKNQAAVVAVTKEQIEKKLRLICENPRMLQEYGDKAWECGCRNHRIKEIQNRLYHDFKELTDEGCAD